MRMNIGVTQAWGRKDDKAALQLGTQSRPSLQSGSCVAQPSSSTARLLHEGPFGFLM